MPVRRVGSISAGLKQLVPEMRAALKPVVYDIAGDIQSDAQISISTGAVSGKNHKPSAPGTPPNYDLGGLADGIIVEKVSDLVARVVSTARYGAIQELGGSTGTATLPERPYMRPAAKKNEKQGKALMRAAVDRVLKGGKL